MTAMAKALEVEGYTVLNLNYPSTRSNIQTLAGDLRSRIRTQTRSASTVHFVTHSMGGILVRAIQKNKPLPNIGRVVMLAPPNQGSEVVDTLGKTWIFKKLNGPAGQQLGTDVDGYLAQLGPVPFECGILTGDRSINWINSILIPGKDDGKVSVTRAKVDGMTDYKIVHTTHPMIMKKKAVIKDTLAFLRSGHFTPPTSE